MLESGMTAGGNECLKLATDRTVNDLNSSVNATLEEVGSYSPQTVFQGKCNLCETFNASITTRRSGSKVLPCLYEKHGSCGRGN